MSGTTLKYNLQQFKDISFSEFTYEISNDTYNLINALCSKVGSVGIANRVFQKKAPVSGKKRKGNKAMEVSEEDWESIRAFQVTKIDQKTGLDAEMSNIKSFLNKITDKNYLDMRDKIIDKMNYIVNQNPDAVFVEKLSTTIYDACVSDKFNSKIFSDLYADLVTMYGWLREVFDKKTERIFDNYDKYRYIDSDKDYDGYCEMNKTKEKTKSITMFYLNLALNGFIDKTFVVSLLKALLDKLFSMIELPDLKAEADEIVDNICVLYNKEIVEEVEDRCDDKYYVNDESIVDVIESLSDANVSYYKSLSQKSKFKFMDLLRK